VQAAREFGRRMAEAKIPVLSIDGNHDLSGGKWARLCGFVPLPQDTADGTPMFNAGGTWFAGVDFCRTQQLVERLKSLKERGCDLHGGVLALHMEIAELTAYSTALSLRDLEPLLDALNVGYVALGHIHNAVSTSTEAGRIYRYPGSTEMNDISELGPKYVDVVTAESGSRYTYDSLALATRRFEVVDVDTAEAIDEKLAPALRDPETFWLVKVNLAAPGKPIVRVEELLKDRLFRILPYGNRTIAEKTERANVVVGLKDAIGKFFDLDSDEASLVARMIDAPEQVKAIAAEYAAAENTENETKKETRK
jgi:DNA repair exonuclease SbcCD nuclease subunit